MKRNKSDKMIDILFMLEKWSKNMLDNFDDLECSMIDELYPHMKKMKKILLEKIEDGNWDSMKDFIDYLEDDESVAHINPLK